MIKRSRPLYSYEDATIALARAANRSSIRLNGTTRLVRMTRPNHPDAFGIEFLDTIVVEIHKPTRSKKSEYYVLRTDNYRTLAVMNRLNEYSPAIVQPIKGSGDWYVHDPPRDPVPFYEGITVDADGHVLKERSITT